MDEWIIVGLGNPGDEYVGTRHNVGRAIIDAIVHEQHFSPLKKNNIARARETKGQWNGVSVRLVQPDTYMNISGESVRFFLTEGEAFERLIVVHDDMDLPLGRMKISFDSGAGGHHGVESVIAHVKSQAFTRVRIGISPTDAAGLLKKERDPNFVIQPFTAQEQPLLDEAMRMAQRAIEAIIFQGRDVAMNEWNAKQSPA